MTKFNQTGELILTKQSIDRLNYGVYDSGKTTFLSITDILDKVYEASNKQIDFRLNILGEGFKSHSIVKSGLLTKGYDKYGVYGYMIGRYPVELELDEQVGKIVAVYIETSEDFADEEDALAYIGVK